jgi:hypothetical protein
MLGSRPLFSTTVHADDVRERQVGVASPVLEATQASELQRRGEASEVVALVLGREGEVFDERHVPRRLGLRGIGPHDVLVEQRVDAIDAAGVLRALEEAIEDSEPTQDDLRSEPRAEELCRRDRALRSVY